VIHEKQVADVRVIKRYANRKLYDTQHSRYVTLEQISDMIREGDDVQIIDNKTKEDLTSVTLAQIIFEEEKKQKSFLPLQTMRNIIATGGESISQLVTTAQQRVTDAFHVKKKHGEDGEIVVEPVPTETAGPPERKPTSLPEFREWVVNTQRTIDEWQKRVDDRIRNVVEGISPFAGVQKDIRELASRIAELETKLTVIAAEEAEAQAQAAADPEAGDTDHAPAANGDGSHVADDVAVPRPDDA